MSIIGKQVKFADKYENPTQYKTGFVLDSFIGLYNIISNNSMTRSESYPITFYWIQVDDKLFKVNPNNIIQIID